jgi:hypothetical protein
VTEPQLGSPGTDGHAQQCVRSDRNAALLRWTRKCAACGSRPTDTTPLETNEGRPSSVYRAERASAKRTRDVSQKFGVSCRSRGFNTPGVPPRRATRTTAVPPKASMPRERHHHSRGIDLPDFSTNFSSGIGRCAPGLHGQLLRICHAQVGSAIPRQARPAALRKWPQQVAATSPINRPERLKSFST